MCALPQPIGNYVSRPKLSFQNYHCGLSKARESTLEVIAFITVHAIRKPLRETNFFNAARKPTVQQSNTSSE
ncbi:hypothetical protein KM043_016054 [Ampulex compressa]|nr:hypothetical protein KM043_016054 [Ampulex compressa]